MEFGAHLRDLRRRRRMTQKQLAEAVGVDFTYISKVENGRVDPPSETTIRKLAMVLEVDPEDLLVRAAKLSSDLKEAASEEPQLALLLRTLGRRRLSPQQYHRMLEIATDEESERERG